MNPMDIDVALANLLEKYQVAIGQPVCLGLKEDDEQLQLVPGHFFGTVLPKINQIPLLTWRTARKFTELKKIVEDTVIQDPCLFRFCCMGDPVQWSLFSLLYRELDLLEYIGNSKVLSVQAVISDQKAGNVMVRLENQALCSIEVSIQMPVGSSMIERHEIIARRGVTSDLVVDTQIPQSSVYCYTSQGETHFTDVDNELFGLDNLQIEHVRSAFRVLEKPDLAENWRQQHLHLCTLIDMVFESNNMHQRIFSKGGQI